MSKDDFTLAIFGLILGVVGGFMIIKSGSVVLCIGIMLLMWGDNLRRTKG